MRLRLAGGLDLATGALILGGAALVAASVVVAVVLLAPPKPAEPAPVLPAAGLPTPARAAEALPLDRVAAVLRVDSTAGAGAVARPGDRIDVFGYFSRQVTGAENLTRALLNDVPVLAVERTGPSVALTLAVPQADALLLQEAQALGARPFVALRPARRAALSALPSTFSDADLAERLSGAR